MLDVASYACAFISLHASCLKQFQPFTFVLTSNSGYKGELLRKTGGQLKVTIQGITARSRYIAFVMIRPDFTHFAFLENMQTNKIAAIANSLVPISADSGPKFNIRFCRKGLPSKPIPYRVIPIHVRNPSNICSQQSDRPSKRVPSSTTGDDIPSPK